MNNNKVYYIMTYINPRHTLGMAYICDIICSYWLIDLYSISMCLLAYIQMAYVMHILCIITITIIFICCVGWYTCQIFRSVEKHYSQQVRA